jgi:hypothetical protein
MLFEVFESLMHYSQLAIISNFNFIGQPLSLAPQLPTSTQLALVTNTQRSKHCANILHVICGCDSTDSCVDVEISLFGIGISSVLHLGTGKLPWETFLTNLRMVHTSQVVT